MRCTPATARAGARSSSPCSVSSTRSGRRYSAPFRRSVRACACSLRLARSARRDSPRSYPARPNGSESGCSAARARGRGCTARPATATFRRPTPAARSPSPTSTSWATPPAGNHTAWAYTHGPQIGIDWGGELPAHVDRVEEQVERFAPGFRDRILARHVMGPADLQRRDQNLVGGDVGGGSYRLRQVVFRPVPRLSPYRTPLRGLYLGSAAAFPGGAVHGVPGDSAALAALADERSGRTSRR